MPTATLGGGLVEVAHPGGDVASTAGGHAGAGAVGVAAEGGGAVVGDYTALTHFCGLLLLVIPCEKVSGLLIWGWESRVVTLFVLGGLVSW